MRSFFAKGVALVLSATLVNAGGSSPGNGPGQNVGSYVDAYLRKEVPIASSGLFANIGPSGSRVPGAGVCGVLLQCVRDSDFSFICSLAW